MEENKSKIWIAVDDAGGVKASARLCDVTHQAVLRWCNLGRLPRTELTGETEYAKALAGKCRFSEAELHEETRTKLIQERKRKKPKPMAA